MKEPKRQSVKATKTTNNEKAWLAYQRVIEEETPKRLEEVAKFLSGIFSIVLTIFLMGDPKLIQKLEPFIIQYIAAAWLLSLLMALLVVFPRGYRFNDRSAESIEKTHRKVVKWKYWCLIVAAAAFFSGFLILVIEMFF